MAQNAKQMAGSSPQPYGYSPSNSYHNIRQPNSPSEPYQTSNVSQYPYQMQTQMAMPYPPPQPQYPTSPSLAYNQS